MGQRWLASLLALILLSPSPSRAEPAREFVMSAVYGTLAGTLVGVASLAFTSQPGENLRNIARGASLGLYAGILLGAYIVYVVPNQISNEEEPEAQPPSDEDPEGMGVQHSLPLPVPLVSERGEIEGAGLVWQVGTF